MLATLNFSRPVPPWWKEMAAPVALLARAEAAHLAYNAGANPRISHSNVNILDYLVG